MVRGDLQVPEAYDLIPSALSLSPGNRTSMQAKRPRPVQRPLPTSIKTLDELSDPLVSIAGVAVRLGVTLEEAEALYRQGHLPAPDHWVQREGGPLPRWRDSTIKRWRADRR